MNVNLMVLALHNFFIKIGGASTIEINFMVLGLHIF